MAESLACRMPDRWPVVLRPVPAQGVTQRRPLLDPSGHLQLSVRIGQRAMAQGVGGELVQGHADRHGDLGRLDGLRSLQAQGSRRTSPSQLIRKRLGGGRTTLSRRLEPGMLLPSTLGQMPFRSARRIPTIASDQPFWLTST